MSILPAEFGCAGSHEHACTFWVSDGADNQGGCKHGPTCKTWHVIPHACSYGSIPLLVFHVVHIYKQPANVALTTPCCLEMQSTSKLEWKLLVHKQTAVTCQTPRQTHRIDRPRCRDAHTFRALHVYDSLLPAACKEMCPGVPQASNRGSRHRCCANLCQRSRQQPHLQGVAGRERWMGPQG